MKKVLIANRGEIALRVIRSVRQKGMSPIAVYSEADRGSMHVRLADEAYLLGGSSPAESYLNIPKILQVAKDCGAFGIHPGYGFLAENAPFAKACEDNGVRLIGPTSESMASMGDKIEARTLAQAAGLPMVPASPPLANVAEAKVHAKTIGYPVLLKAKAGGGGKGMRRAMNEKELEEGFRLASSEAKKSFADDTLYLERFVLSPRHVEVQVFGDEHGNVVSLGDRECSIQRRHQKIIEEAPAPNLSPATKEKMSEAARNIAKAVRYRGAGTVEFLIDAKEQFYFLEMNTRLQVEHPVTEWITGYDLVSWQLDVAEGKRLPVTQTDITFRGSSIEVRLYAEDPENNFFPSPGTLNALQWPSGPGVRIDSGVERGSEISLFYDPLLAKISVWGETRAQAVERMSIALNEVRVGGVKTNLSLLQKVLAHPRFREGKLTTTFLQEEGPLKELERDSLALDAALATLYLHENTRRPVGMARQTEESSWWRSGLPRRKIGPVL